MVDISMCRGIGCDKRNSCYRHRAVPSPHWQSYMQPNEVGDACKWYQPLMIGDVIRPEVKEEADGKGNV